MKQGKIYTKIILWIFLAAVVCYFAYYVFSAIYAPLATVTAIEYEAGSGSYTTGYVVRQESIVQSHYEITTLVVAEGERVSAGQALATGYRNTDAQDRQVKIQDLEHQLEPKGFLRIHKSYLVNMRHLKKFQCREAVLSNGTVLRVGEKTYADKKKKYLLWKGWQ